MSPDRIEQLNTIGFIWDLCDNSWNEHFNQLCAFKANNGHCNVSKYDAQNKSLGKWVNMQRVFYNKNALSSNHIQQLNSIGFVWDPLEHAWNENFDQLCVFKAQHGHCNVSENDEGHKSLGMWVRSQRKSYKKNALSSDRIQQLNSMGIVWDPLEHAWSENFDQLCAFKAQHGHCDVSENDEGNRSLGLWGRTQRKSYKKNTLSSDRIQQLNSICFVWDLCDHSWNENEICCALKGAVKQEDRNCNADREKEARENLEYQIRRALQLKPFSMNF